MHPRLLIVDDHERFRSSLKEYLSMQGLNIEIYEASTGEMAITKASCIRPHIVLMDVSLPGENGFQASLQIIEDHPQCDVIILTMFETDSLKEISKKLRVKEFIGKSEIYEKLVPLLKACIAKKNGLKKRKRKEKK